MHDYALRFASLEDLNRNKDKVLQQKCASPTVPFAVFCLQNFAICLL